MELERQNQRVSFRMVDEVDEVTRQKVLAPLHEYNRERSVEYFKARDLPENAPRPLNILALNGSGQTVAGLLAETQFSWLRISILSVSAELRRNGIGRELMRRAEREALTRGCKYALLDTMDYQAPMFYEKLGYRLSGTFPDWDSHGHARLFFVKQLMPE